MSGDSGEVHDLKCPDCNQDMVLRDSRYGKFYGCCGYPDCWGTHGAHADGTPLGIPADKETKLARIRTHDVFDRLWRGGPMSRRMAYHWMCAAMDMTPQEAHIGRFTKEQCATLIDRVLANFEVPT